jgi:AbrB family looped-hinge helix DNA binding protein
MATLTVTVTGQVTLPKEVLEHLGVRPGDKITVDKLPDGQVVVRAARPTGKISAVFNRLQRQGGPAPSIEEINEITARSWAGEQ